VGGLVVQGHLNGNEWQLKHYSVFSLAIAATREKNNFLNNTVNLQMIYFVRHQMNLLIA
jgi:hypothetical protein